MSEYEGISKEEKDFQAFKWIAKNGWVEAEVGAACTAMKTRRDATKLKHLMCKADVRNSWGNGKGSLLLLGN